MVKPVDNIFHALNAVVEKTAQTEPDKCTFQCSECGKTYVAQSAADMYVCPLCGGVQHDEDEEGE